VLDEGIEFSKGALVKEQVDALASRQLALGMLFLDALFTTAHFGLLPEID
jgi:hypothetical protein